MTLKVVNGWWFRLIEEVVRKWVVTPLPKTAHLHGICVSAFEWVLPSAWHKCNTGSVLTQLGETWDKTDSVKTRTRLAQSMLQMVISDLWQKAQCVTFPLTVRHLLYKENKTLECYCEDCEVLLTSVICSTTSWAVRPLRFGLQSS